MRWTRDEQAPLGDRLRVFVVLGLVVAIVLETPLRGVTGMPAWLTPGGTSLAAGSVRLPSGEPGAPMLAAAKKHKRHKQNKRDTQKSDKPGKRKSDKKDTRGKGKASKKGTHPGAGRGTNKSTGDKPGKHEGTQDRTRTDHTDATARIAADDLTTADSPADLTAAADAAMTVAPVADAQVNEANPNHNYGATRRLLVDGGGDDPDIESYLRFDVSGVAAPVQRATLRLWVQSNGGTQNGPEVRSTDTSWSETDLTWSNRPAPSGGPLDDTGRLSGGTWVEYDVTSAVSADGPVAFVLLPQSNDGAVFDSRQGDQGPELVIAIVDDTQPPPPEPSPTSTSEPDPTAPPEPTAQPTALPTLTPEPTATPTPPSGETATLLAAGDIASCSSSGDEATAKLLDDLPGTVATLGDTVYEAGTTREFADCYDPSWGRHKSRTRPALGNHEYLTSGATGYFGYFGSAAGDPQQGYYSYELGAWHVVVLNSNCSQAGGCGVGSPQEQWLRADLAAHPTACTLAYWHHPRFSFGNYSNDARMQAVWQALYEAGAEIVLSGHDHNYQRYTPQDAGGVRDDARGIREFVVGTGGKDHYSLGTPPPNVEKFNGDTFGVLQLTLQATGYEWTFVPEADKTFTDMGADTCH